MRLYWEADICPKSRIKQGSEPRAPGSKNRAEQAQRPEVGGGCSVTKTSRRPSYFQEGQGPEEEPDQVVSYWLLLKELGLTRVKWQLLEGGREEACHLTSVPREKDDG